MASVFNPLPNSLFFFFSPVLNVNNGGAPTEGDAMALESSQGLCVNGPTSYNPEQPVPLGPTENSASGVLGFREHQKASRGSSEESLALRKDTLQSLKLSLPLQETELCKHLLEPTCLFLASPSKKLPPPHPLQPPYFHFSASAESSPEC